MLQVKNPAMEFIQTHDTLPDTQRARAVLRHARDSTDAVFALVPFDRWLDRPVPERHRLIFYLGHVEAFDWNLVRCELDLPSPHPSFDGLFAFGIDPKSDGLPDDTPSDWPSVEEVSDYTMAVRRRIDEVVQYLPPVLRHIACEHRLMHAETFTYLLHNLSVPLSAGPRMGSVSPSCRLHDDGDIRSIPSGTATLGQYRQSEGEPGNSRDGFGWDNEFDAHPVYVPSFGIDRYKVTNRRYLAFVEAGAPPPHFWRRREQKWYWRTRNREIPLPLDWPVYVTHEEATAYARWSGKVLPSEAQFHRAAYGTPEGGERAYPWGDGPPTPAHGNFGGRRWNPVGVRATPSGDSAFGVAQLVGNGWEWTSTVFEPFPGFRVHPSYAGYSAPFFDGDHYVLKGGSPVTATPLLRRSFRNWFRTTYRYAYAAFRCVER
ncbi:MAG: Serine/threonine kinase [Nitrospira sp.]|jgi:formylglycine-generating enzyme required for sulfatase activity|nr:MAG: Serine/threonine kinase [Nitrospira sp.]